MNGVDLQIQNSQLRQALLQSAPVFLKDLGTFAGSLGGTTRVKMLNVGIATRIFARVTIDLNIGVAAATLSPRGAYGSIRTLKLIDFDQTDRIKVSGLELFLRNSNRNRTPYGMNNEGAAAIFTNPSVPTAVGNNQKLEFTFEIPVAFDFVRGDLRGILLAQTGVGEWFVQFEWPTVLHQNGLDDFVYNGAATTTVVVNSISVRIFQEYMLPQAINGVVPLPQLDLLTVYELSGALRSTDNLAANAEKLVDIPNVRTVLGSYLTYTHNGIIGGASDPANEIDRQRLIINGNNIIQEYDTTMMRFVQRQLFNGDLGIRGTYVWDFVNRPIQTAIFGNVQIGLTPKTAPSGQSYVDVMHESFYTKGSVLPGMNQTT